MIEKKLPETIRYYRKKRGLSQEALASKAGISAMSVKRYESGSREPSLHTIDRIAQALNITSDKLLGFADPLTLSDHMIQRSAIEDLLLINDYEMILDEDGESVTLDGLNCVYKITLADLDELENSTLDYFKFKLNDIISRAKIIKDRSPSLSIAAHERTDIEVTDEMREHDMKIMEDEDF